MATILEKFCAHGDEVQAALNVAVPGFFRCLDELVYPGDESLPGMVGDQYLVAHLQHRALAGGDLHRKVLHRAGVRQPVAVYAVLGVVLVSLNPCFFHLRILRFLRFPFRCVHIRSKSTYYQVNSDHNLHKDRRNKLCISLLRMAVDRLNDLLLLGRPHANGLERLPGAAVRADKRFVVLP